MERTSSRRQNVTLYVAACPSSSMSVRCFVLTLLFSQYRSCFAFEKRCFMSTIPTRVGMVDMKHRFSKAKHDRYWENSKVKTKQRTDIELDGHAATYNVTFCLREEVRSILGAGFGPR